MDKNRSSITARTLHHLLFLPILLLLAASLACNVPISLLTNGSSEQPVNQPKSSPDQNKSSDNQPSATATFTTIPDTPTNTSSPTPTLTPTVTLTPTPYLIISQNTNCRFGPGSVYDLLYTYLSGSENLPIGKLADETFYYTKDGNGIHPDCWLLAKFATPVGDLSSVPVLTPPPTPTPYLDFTASFEGSDCGAGSCWLWIKVDNAGRIPLESVRVYAQNVSTSADAVFKSNLFQSGIMGSDIASVPVASSGYTHTGQLPNPGGSKVSISVKACSQNGMNGICLTRNLIVNP